MAVAEDGGREVGDLAKAAKFSVRALHHYDQIGLLRPSRRTAAGHRVYDDDDGRRLYRILCCAGSGSASPTSVERSTNLVGSSSAPYLRTT